MASHLRSISLPSRSHSAEAQVEEELQKLTASLAPSSLTIEMTCDGLRRLGDAYNSIEEILCLPSNQAGLSQPQQKKWVAEELERSVKLLDLCHAMQENIIEMRMSIQDMQLILRRGDDAAIQGKHQSFIRLVKKAKNDFKKIDNKCASASAVKEDGSVAVVFRLLRGPREMTISLLQSALCLLPKEIGIPNTRKWSLISKTFQKKKVMCEAEQLQVLESNIRGLESGLEFLLRRLIQSRVTLLNLLSS